MGGVAALLAGFSVTFAALVLSDPERFRWLNPTLFLFTIAAVCLIATLQFTFRAREFSVTPAEIEQWWPSATFERQQEMRREQREHRAAYRRWSNRARRAYNLGIVCFASGFTAALVPPGVISHGRFVVIFASGLGVAAESCWIVDDVLSRRLRLRARSKVSR
jgi:hypothetical protein